MWEKVVDTKDYTRTWISSNLGEIYDLQWSPNGEFIVAGSIDSKVCVN